MSLHRVDPRFVLPHLVSRAVVLGDLEEWRAGLASAGIEVSDGSVDHGPPDLVVSPARLVGEGRSTGARSIIVEGSRESSFRASEYCARRLLLRPTRDRPTLALPLDQPTPVSYALERWSVVDRRWKKVRMRAARALASQGLFPSWASPVVTVATQDAGPPKLIAAAAALDVPSDVHWFLTFGQGDALSRNAFQLFRPGSPRPEWILKFARVAGYSQRFDDDERGLRLANAAGRVVSAHVPRLVGRFDVDGVHASVETAAVGRRLRDVLLTPGDRVAKLRLVDRIAGWILDLGAVTRTSAEALAPERERLSRDVLPQWSEIGGYTKVLEELSFVRGVLQHNDLGSCNVVTDEDGGFVVVDWENAREAALPLWDLLYFLGDALVLVDEAATPEQVSAKIARLFAGDAPSSPLLFSWVRRGADAAALPPEAVGPIATLCWLSHSLALAAHTVDLAAWRPHDPPRTHGLEDMARTWLEHPALGPSWSRWHA